MENYLLRFVSFLDKHPDLLSALEEDVITDILVSGLLPRTLRSTCKTQRFKSRNKAVVFLKDQLVVFESHRHVEGLKCDPRDPKHVSSDLKNPKARNRDYSKAPSLLVKDQASFSEFNLVSQANNADLSSPAATSASPPRKPLKCYNCAAAHHWRVCTEECRGGCPRNSTSHVPKDCPVRSSAPKCCYHYN